MDMIYIHYIQYYFNGIFLSIILLFYSFLSIKHRRRFVLLIYTSSRIAMFILWKIDYI